MASVEETIEMAQFTNKEVEILETLKLVKEVEILETLKLVEGSNLWSITLRRMRRDTLGMFGFGVVIALCVVAIIAFGLTLYDNWFGLYNPTADPWDVHNYFIEIWIPGTERYIRLIAHPKHIIAGDEAMAPSAQYPFVVHNTHLVQIYLVMTSFLEWFLVHPYLSL